MKRTHLLLIAWAVAFFAVAVNPGQIGKAMAAPIWSDDFESSTPGEMPTDWTYSGNSDIHVDNTVSVSGSQSVRMYGILGSCWGALIHRPLNVSPPFTVEVWVRNGAENLSGCHPQRAGLALFTGPSWTTSPRTLMISSADGRVLGAPAVQSDWPQARVLGPYASNEWMNWRVGYERSDESTIKVSYWINDEYKGADFLPSYSYEDQLGYLSLMVGEGTVWFDDVVVTPGVAPEPSQIPTLSGASAGLLVLALFAAGRQLLMRA